VATDARMLIVDSDVHAAQALARLMEQHDYPAPALASSVWKAMESVEDSLPDVVVFSLYYPNVDPLLFCRALKQAHPLLPIMVIISPGASLREIETVGVLAGGIDAVLEQPLDEARCSPPPPSGRQRRRCPTASLPWNWPRGPFSSPM